MANKARKQNDAVSAAPVQVPATKATSKKASTTVQAPAPAPAPATKYQVKADAKTKPNTFGALIAKLTAKPATMAEIISGLKAADTGAKGCVPLSVKNHDMVIRVRAKHFVKTLCTEQQ